MVSRPLPSIKVNEDYFFEAPGYYKNFSTDSLKPRGLALIINNFDFGGVNLNGINLDRLDSKKDLDDMTAVLKDLGYKVMDYEDKVVGEMASTSKDFVNESKKSDYQSCIIVAMTHGSMDENGSSYLLDRYQNKLSYKEFMGPIMWSEHLADIPKLFFIQACRDDPDDTLCRGKPKRCGPLRVPLGQNTFLFNSTLAGCKSYRLSQYGALFIQAICKVFRRCAHERWANLDAMAECIACEVASTSVGLAALGLVPQSCFSNQTLSKHFHFFPVQVVHCGLKNDGKEPEVATVNQIKDHEMMEIDDVPFASLNECSPS